MITLNLLPPDLKKRHRPTLSATSLKLPFLPRINLFVVCLYVAGAFLILHSFLLLIFFGWSLSLKGLKGRWESVAQKRQVVAEITERHTELLAREGVVQQLAGKRLSWSKKLQGLAESVPTGIWLRRLSVGEVTLPSQAPKEPRGAKGVATAKAPRGGAVGSDLRKALILEGTAASLRRDEPAIIGRLIRSLKENPLFFADVHDVVLESMKRRSIEKIEVMDFKVVCTFQEGVLP